MTDQPTTWTWERALQCLRDWASDECDWPKWRRKYEDGIDHGEIAQDLLRRCGAIAAAEIERLRDEVTQLEGMERQRDAETARADAAEKEVEVLRGFLRGEVKVREDAQADAERLRAALAAKQLAEAEAAQQGPSDEVIRDALANHIHGPELRHVLRLLARRAGVKL